MITFRQATTADSLLLSRGLHAALLINDVTDERLRRFADLVCSRHDVLYSPQNTTVRPSSPPFSSNERTSV